MLSTTRTRFFITISNSIKFGQRQGIYTASGIALGILINTFIVYWFGSFLLYKEPILFKCLILIGAFTNLANAKVLVFFSSMLSLVDGLSSFGKIGIWRCIALTTFVWFCIVATFFGNNKLRQIFFRNIKKLELISAVFITVFVIIILIELF